MGRKGFASPLIIVLVIALLTGATMLLLFKSKTSKINSRLRGNVNIQSTESLSQPTSSPSTKPSPDLGYSEDSETQGFKLYKNNKYKVSFTYPEEWKLDTKDSGGTYPMLDIHLSNGVASNNPAQCTTKYAGLEIQVGHPNPESQTFDEIVKQQAASGSFGMGGSLEKIQINGKSSYKLERSGWDTACAGPGYFIDQDENNYTYVFTGKGSDANFEITEKIVMSIKFEK